MATFIVLGHNRAEALEEAKSKLKFDETLVRLRGSAEPGPPSIPGVRVWFATTRKKKKPPKLIGLPRKKAKKATKPKGVPFDFFGR